MKKILIIITVLVTVSCSSKVERTLLLPDRPANALSGSDFVLKIDNMGMWKMDSLMVREILSGNVPSFMRTFREVTYDRNGHIITFWTLPDYLSIGSDDNYIRVPMSSLAAQEIADSLYCSLPTALLVDKIFEASEGAIDPFPFRPKDGRNSYPITYEDSDHAIKALFKAKGYKSGDMISGLKKDIIITEKITSDTSRLNHVTIYGWHYPDGHRIQNPTNIHINYYADYSHGVRLLHRIVLIDGISHDIQDVLKDSTKYFLLSDESSPMTRPTYAGDIRHRLGL